MDQCGLKFEFQQFVSTSVPEMWTADGKTDRETDMHCLLIALWRRDHKKQEVLALAHDYVKQTSLQ